MSKLFIGVIFLLLGALIMALVAFFLLPAPTPPASGPAVVAPPESLQVPRQVLPADAPARPAPPPMPKLADLNLPQAPPNMPADMLERLKDPQVLSRVATKTKADLEIMYSDLLVKLSDADAAKMVNALVEEQMARGQKALTAGPPASHEQMQEEMAASESRLRSAMGESLFQTYAEAQNSMRERRMARDFSAAADSSNMSLTAEQKAALVGILVQEKQALQSHSGQFEEAGSASASQSARERVADRAREFLSLEQVGALKHFLSSQQSRPGMPRR